MSIYNRIAAIQARMQEIQSRFGAGSTKPADAEPGGDYQAMPVNNSGITFEKLLATRMGEQGRVSPPIGDTISEGPKDTDKLPELSKPLNSTPVNRSSLSERSGEFDDVINETCSKYGVDANFVRAIIQQESGFNPNATSWVGAMGLMQLMPGTARDLGVQNAYDPRDNVEGGVKYIKEQLDRFGGDKRKALAAYNAGPGAVLKYGDVPPYSETQNYVKNIMSIYESINGDK